MVATRRLGICLAPIGILLGLIALAIPERIAYAQDATHVIALTDGSIGYGQMMPNQADSQLAVWIQGFKQPFKINQNNLSSLRVYNSGEPQARPISKNSTKRNWLFRLRDRQQVVGSIESLDDQWLMVDSESFGKLRIARKDVLQVEQASSPGEMVRGAIRSEDWQDPNDTNLWTLDATRIATTKPGARLISKFAPPTRFEVNLLLRWDRKPNFAIGIGVDNKANANPQQVQWGVPAGGKATVVGHKPCFASLEVWGTDLVLVRESEQESAIAVVGSAESKSCSLTFFVDIKAGKVALQTEGGELIELNAPSKMIAGKLQALQFQNFGGGLSIEQLEISKWSGNLPLSIADKTGLVKLKKGEALNGVIESWDSQNNQWIVRSDEKTTSINVDDLFAGSVTVESDSKNNEQAAATEKATGGEKDSTNEPDKTTAPKASDPAQSIEQVPENQLSRLRLATFDGSRLVGDLLASRQEKIRFKSLIIAEEVELEIALIRQLSTESSDRKTADAEIAATPVAICGHSEIKGYLLENSPENSQSALQWQPTLALNSSELDHESFGEIRFGEQKSKAKKPETTKRDNPAQPERNMILQLFRVGQVAVPAQAPALDQAENDGQADAPAVPTKKMSKLATPVIRFRTGDSAPANIQSINEGGIRFESTRTATTFAPDSSIDHVVFRESKSVSISPEQRKRLLTIPRAQQNDPPTHLIVSAAGDYLRGRLVDLNQDQVTIEVRGEMLSFPIDDLAEIVWLYERNWKTPSDLKEKTRSEVVEEAGKGLVYAVYGKDQGMSFVPKNVKEGVIFGSSDLLGDSQIKIGDLTALYWGADCGKRAKESDHESFSLSLAQQPRVPSEDEAGGQASQSHPLVGKQAPNFTLKNLNGDSVQLEKLQGQIVVLDFWATWCGPCMQAMPQLDQLIGQFDNQKVKLLAVNLQEPKNRINLALDKLKISPEVLLDEEGEIGAAYQANAIPQTVIVDPTGRVSHVFVGGGNQTLMQIRQALMEQVQSVRD